MTDPEEQATLEEDENNLVITTTSPRIRTLEQQINAMGVDLDVWTADRHLTNSWETAMKLSDDSVVVVPIYQVKAWWIRREPTPIHPVLSPIHVTAKLPDSVPASRHPPWRVALNLGDLHLGFSRDLHLGEMTPFHDRRALDLTWQLARLIKPDTLIFGGDALDLSEWTDKFTRDPEFAHTTQPALIELAWWFGRFRRILPHAEIIYLEGNHEHRIKPALINHLLAAYKLKPVNQLNIESALTLPVLLGLDDLNIQWIDGYHDDTARLWLSDKLTVEHGSQVNSPPGHTAGNIVRTAGQSVIFNHIHRRELATRQVHDRNGHWTKTAICGGCLCRIDNTVPGHKIKQGWQQGATLATYDGEGFQDLRIIPIHEGRAYHNGYTIRSQDPTPDLITLERETKHRLI